jgi:crotonobetainyl-CoA:carnitine CoA-transferase CaiB-like acyl-CoA transferase
MRAARSPPSITPRAVASVSSCPVRLSASPAVTTAPPLAGEHTAEVLGEMLGLSKEDVAALQERGAIA